MSSAKRNLVDLRRSKKSEPKSRVRARIAMSSMLPERGLRLKTRRRRKRILLACICLLAGAGLVGTLGAASHLEQLAINSVSVTGAEKLETEALTAAVSTSLNERASALFSRKNMFLYSRGSIEKALSAQFPRINNVSVARESMLAQALVVTVQEREPFAKWCNEVCYAMDATGFIYAGADEPPKTEYTFRGGLVEGDDPIGQYFLRGRIYGAVALLEDVRNAGFPSTGLTVESENDFSIALTDGPLLRASFDMPSGTVIDNLRTAIAADSLKDKLGALEYIDLRFGNRVYYK